MAIVAFKNYTIGAGTPAIATSTLTFLGTGTAGTPGAMRILTHPDGANFAPIIYFSNPDESVNIDNDVLTHPIVTTVQTLSSRVTTRFEQGIDDILVGELWFGGGRRASMPTSFLRKLLEYMFNAPTAGTFVTWQPRDLNDFTYNVTLVSLLVGGRLGELEVVDVIDLGGKYDGGSIENALDSIDTVRTGLVPKQIKLTMKIESQV